MTAVDVGVIALRAVDCPRCGAVAGQSCAAAMRVHARSSGDEEEARELAKIDAQAPQLSHPERLAAVEQLIQSAEAYGLVRRIPRDPA